MSRDDLLEAAEGLLTLADLVRLSGLEAEVVRNLVEMGAFEPVPGKGADWAFEARCAVLARSAGRLHRDLGLDAAGIAVAIAYQERIASLERELQRLRCLLLEG